MRLWDGVTEENYYPVDIKPTSEKVTRADLVLETVPFRDNFFGVVTAHDFMEHIPYCIYVNSGASVVRINPLINLFNEIYRVLEHGGLFHMQSPAFPSNASVSDPGHVSYWTEESVNYYSGDYFGWHDHYGHTSRFEKVDCHKDERERIQMTLRAVKNLPKDHPYQLTY